MKNDHLKINQLGQWLEQARAITLLAHHRATSLLPGQYRSLFKGRGIEYESSREYVMGDDPKRIDWRLTARRGLKKEDGTYQTPYIKEFCEEREVTVILASDVSGSLRYYGAESHTKLEIATHTCGLLASSAVLNHDRVGLTLFTQNVELCIPPGKGIHQVIKIIYSLLAHQPKSNETDLTQILHFLVSQYRRRCLVFLISDFLSKDREFGKYLKVAAQKHELVAVHITDHSQMPDVGLSYLRDAETGEEILVDTSSNIFQQQYTQHLQQRKKNLAAIFADARVPVIQISNQESVLTTILRHYHT